MPHPGNHPRNRLYNGHTRNQEHTPLRGGGNNIAPNYYSIAGSTRGDGKSDSFSEHSLEMGDDVPQRSPFDATGSTRSPRLPRPSGSQSQPAGVGVTWPSRLSKDKAFIKGINKGFIFFFFLGGLIAWFLQDVWAMSILNPSAIEKRRVGWDQEYAEHQTQAKRMIDVTVKWAQETEQHQSARRDMQAEREEWKKERAVWLTESLEREKLQQAAEKIALEKEQRELDRQKDEETRKEAEIQWQDPQSAQCLRFGVRRYTAKLENVPKGYNRLKACRETVSWIEGRALYPSECRDQGLWGGIEGTWIIDQDEAGCHTYWQDFNDKGCTASGSGKRRIESQLQNLQTGDDGLMMCSSTPADFHGLHFEGPHSCTDWFKSSYWGQWFIDDASCR